MVSLLINVSWGENHIPGILRTLKKHNVKATFFIEGNWAKKHVDYVEMIAEEGHSIGNHAYSHPDMAQITKSQTIEEIQKTNDVLEAITNQKPDWFAPPSGSFNNHVVNAVHELNMETVLWSVDTIDWKNPTPSVMMNRVMSKVHKGATILMHPTPVIEQGLDLMITELKKKNYKLGTIEQLLDEKR
ncbi:polysaccharide deacetylase family protein [Lentibacillus sp. JNUCC-1]|uniref:polysaccharide deacetylase family protein n=1 Tax=Lentibacillus sp. JNUCC-1 TaxID=2654513 RepID=UPI002F9115B8